MFWNIYLNNPFFHFIFQTSLKIALFNSWKTCENYWLSSQIVEKHFKTSSKERKKIILTLKYLINIYMYWILLLHLHDKWCLALVRIWKLPNINLRPTNVQTALNINKRASPLTCLITNCLRVLTDKHMFAVLLISSSSSIISETSMSADFVQWR